MLGRIQAFKWRWKKRTPLPLSCLCWHHSQTDIPFRGMKVLYRLQVYPFNFIMCTSILAACIPVHHVSVWCLWKPEGVIRSRDSLWASVRERRLEAESSEEQLMLWSAEPSLQACKHVFYWKKEEKGKPSRKTCREKFLFFFLFFLFPVSAE